MKLGLVGVGDAGCRITNRIVAVERRTRRKLSDGNVVLINTREPEFDTTSFIDADRRLLIGDVHHGVDGRGVDGDPDLGADVARDDRHEIIRSFDLIEPGQIDALLVVAGLGRGTGGGAGPVVLDEFQELTDLPVYSLAVLPQSTSSSSTAMNAARSLQSFVDTADNVIGFDNDTWQVSDGDSPGDFAEANAELAKRVVTLFAVGESERASMAEQRLDSSDFIHTLGTGGLSTIGYAATSIEPNGIIQRWLRGLTLPWSDGEDDDVGTAATKIKNLVRRAANSRLTVPCNIASAERAIILLSGPSRELSRKGFESGRYWLEQEAEVVDVKAGDEPHERTNELEALVLFSNVTDVPRIESLKAQAVEQ